MNKQPTISEVRSALAAAKAPPQEYFARLVRRGIVNAHGQVTKLFGGEAEPEKGAQRPDDQPVLTERT